MQDEAGLWNGFFSFMCNHLSLSSWTTASSIVRATSKSIDGPYSVQQMGEFFSIKLRLFLVFFWTDILRFMGPFSQKYICLVMSCMGIQPILTGCL